MNEQEYNFPLSNEISPSDRTSPV